MLELKFIGGPNVTFTISPGYFDAGFHAWYLVQMEFLFKSASSFYVFSTR